MRKLKKISVFFILFLCVFLAGILTEKIWKSFYPNIKNENIPITDGFIKEETTTPAGATEEVITADTRLIIIEHKLESGEENSTENYMPVKYIGLNRERFLEEMEIYETSPALTDIRKGFQSLQVLNFSKEQITMQKNYKENNVKLRFYMIAKDNKLVVYYEDMETIFLSTDISIESLPENVKREVLQKKYFESEEELYNFLESYSS